MAGSAFGGAALGCKFTPLGFETDELNSAVAKQERVNLPRWGLKLAKGRTANYMSLCKFTPLGFETRLKF